MKAIIHIVGTIIYELKIPITTKDEDIMWEEIDDWISENSPEYNKLVKMGECPEIYLMGFE